MLRYVTYLDCIAISTYKTVRQIINKCFNRLLFCCIEQLMYSQYLVTLTAAR